mgnify:CR=1 FL=1
MAQHFTDKDYKAEVLDSKIPVMVDFYAEWCGPCKQMAPIVDDLAKEYEGKIKIGKIDVDANPETPQMYGVQSIPTFVLIKGGEVVNKFTGARSKDDVEEMLNAML